MNDGAVIVSSSIPWKPPFVVEVALNVRADSVPVLKVLAPANVCVPVVTIPEADALALGIVTLVPVDELIIGPAVVPAVAVKLAAAALIVIDPVPFVIVTFEP